MDKERWWASQRHTATSVHQISWHSDPNHHISQTEIQTPALQDNSVAVCFRTEGTRFTENGTGELGRQLAEDDWRHPQLQMALTNNGLPYLLALRWAFSGDYISHFERGSLSYLNLSKGAWLFLSHNSGHWQWASAPSQQPEGQTDTVQYIVAFKLECW